MLVKSKSMIFMAVALAGGLSVAMPAFAAEDSRGGFYTMNGAVYWVEDDIAVTGWRQKDGNWYYFDHENGILKTGFFRDEGGVLYHSGDDGALTGSGWNQIGDSWYYMEDSGAVATETWVGPYWLRADGTWDPEQVGGVHNEALIAAGLSWEGNGWVLRNGDGSLVTGDWRTLNGTRYYFGADSRAVRGWQYIGGYKYYFDEETCGLVQNLDGILAVQASYYITVDRDRCQITVYAPDGDNGYIIPCRTFLCSPGAVKSSTPAGTFQTTDKYRWHELNGPTYGQYCTRIGRMPILFHSVPGNTMSIYNVSASKYNKLGQPASGGCIRMTVADAKWIYDNCAAGTTVTIGDSLPAPFDKPEGIKIPAGQNWDPTDPAIRQDAGQ